MRVRVDALDAFVFLICAAYAAFLQAVGNKERLEPDYVWLEVAIGDAIILLGGAALRVRLDEANGRRVTWRDYEWAVGRAFVVGGLPVILWQMLLVAIRQERARNYLRREAVDGEDEAVAEERQ